MGFVLSKFRKEKSTTAVLEGLQTKIHELEKYMINTQDRKRRFVTNFIGFTIGIYIVGFALWYFFYFPPTMQERIMYLVPLLLFPILIVFLRRLFTWYFQRKLNKNGDKLADLKQQKTKILEQVMDKETYKVAVNLLERFGDKQQTRMLNLGGQLNTSVRTGQNSTPSALNRSTIATLQRTPQPTAHGNTLTPYTSVYRNVNNNLNSSIVTAATPQVRIVQELRRRTPFPVVDESSRSALDRIVDYVLGDSPHKRFGMICKECHKHNGMLPLEEYEYTTFHCAFCGVLNPARKERPVAPRLSLEAMQPETPKPPGLRSDSSDTDSSDDEDEESDKRLLTRRMLHHHQDLPTTDNEMDSEAEGSTVAAATAAAAGDATTIGKELEEEETETEAAKAKLPIAASETEAKE